ncbi:hypothetical protein DPMN_153184 [Dreissena polymorpha]|uniref:Uncharacterized protein n=1 Tax=Dreissena polymorpha TaxID=45954 RepID=A0A9D4FLU5_DREPO|nr:hypothetical protein DPMN_153184 [Dreissena polymorpha]
MTRNTLNRLQLSPILIESARQEIDGRSACTRSLPGDNSCLSERGPERGIPTNRQNDAYYAK